MDRFPAVALVLVVNLALSLLLLYSPGRHLLLGFIAGGLNPQIINLDFGSFWVAGQAIRTGDFNLLFGHDNYFALAQSYFGNQYEWHSWSYPPHILLLLWPLGYLSLKVGLAVYLASTFFLLWLGIIRVGGAELASRPVFWLMLLPVLALNLVSAQGGFLTSGLLLLALHYQSSARPLAAGICLGLLTIKPQLGVLIPFYLLIERDWRTFAAAAASTLLLIGASIAFFGIYPWRGFFEQTMPFMTLVMAQGTGIFTLMMPTFFMSLRVLGIAPGTALSIQLYLSVGLLSLYFFMATRDLDLRMRHFLLAVFTFLITPYAFNYDMAAAVVLGLTVAGRRLGGAAALTKPLGMGWASAVGVAAWTLALLPVGITSLGRLGYPVGPVVILAVVAVLFLAEVRAPPPESSGTGSSPQGQRAVDDARRVQEQNFDAT